MDGFLQDLKLAVRALWKSPLATGLAMVCLALGIGTNATMFSVVSGTLLNPLPFPEPGEMLVVSATTPDGRRGRAGVSYPDLVDYQDGSGAFDALVGVQGRSLTFSDTDEPERVLGAAVSWRMFSMLGIVPALGRDFTADDDRAGASDGGAAERRAVAPPLQRRPGDRGPRRDRQRAAVHRDRRPAATGQVSLPPERVGSADAAVGRAPRASRVTSRCSPGWRQGGRSRRPARS